jgi:hypothetical protein
VSSDCQGILLCLVDDIDLDAFGRNKFVEHSIGHQHHLTLRDIFGALTVFAVPRNICCAETPEFPTVWNCKGVARVDGGIPPLDMLAGAAAARRDAATAIVSTKEDMEENWEKDASGGAWSGIYEHWSTHDVRTV